VCDKEKEDPMDFALWKAAKPGEPSWESPWGSGRPGWHIECSAMSLKYLGDTLDIHGGGQDLVFPHHENEIAQSESFTGVKPFARYWLHNGLLQLGEEKMSKSLGNLITIKEALEKCSADALRIFILSSHYRSPLTYSDEGLTAAERAADRLRQAVHGTGRGKMADRRAAATDIFRQRFIEAMDDDFNTAQALAILFDLAREINRTEEAGFDAARARERLVELGGILGLSLSDEFLVDTSRPINVLPQEAEKWQLSLDEPVSIDKLISLRQQFREARQFKLADEIRAKLEEHGLVLEDTPEGTVCKRKR
jgi:cysteinyl-tRNA synthetase